MALLKEEEEEVGEVGEVEVEVVEVEIEAGFQSSSEGVSIVTMGTKV